MGVGFILIVNAKDKEKVIEILGQNGENAYEIGHIGKGDEKICLK